MHRASMMRPTRYPLHQTTSNNVSLLLHVWQTADHDRHSKKAQSSPNRYHSATVYGTYPVSEADMVGKGGASDVEWYNTLTRVDNIHSDLALDLAMNRSPRPADYTATTSIHIQSINSLTVVQCRCCIWAYRQRRWPFSPVEYCLVFCALYSRIVTVCIVKN